jgi:hypothetical protein
MTGGSYDDLEIADGTTASLRFLDMTFGHLPERERALVRNQLEIYCLQDTSGMIDIIRALNNIV